MALIDQGSLDIAINFHEASLKKFGIANYLFIGADIGSCKKMSQMNINCYMYKSDKDADKASVYHSKDFLRKMNIRTYMILDALHMGYNILHTDVDMTFLKNPFHDYSYTSTSYDVAPLWDCGAYNAGFLFIRNSQASRELYRMSKNIADTEPKTDDQLALNRAISKTKKTVGLKLHMLDRKKYLCGKAYFEDTKRSFAGDVPCAECVVVHDNWIVSMEAKAYRLKEMHFWVYDNDQYYSSPTRKYLTYSNPEMFKDQPVKPREEIQALMNAAVIAEILNRTLILPKFHCGSKGQATCTILNHILVRNFEAQFPNYRESTFLSHDKVPNEIKHSLSKLYFITTRKSQQPFGKEAVVLEPHDLTRGATDEEIVHWFAGNTESVLRFDSLYYGFCCFTDKVKDGEYAARVTAATKKGAYRQF